jgi:beta-lactamase superfamily II metal-dependent hydrolase
MKAKKEIRSPHRASTKSDTADQVIRIRMYRVGFGDCFLISLPTDHGPEHIVVDCGVHARGNIGKIADAAKNIAVEANNKLALVIATHSHQDHISGFATCEREFQDIKVREVWLPWTENPKDTAAVKLKKKHTALCEMLARHFQARPASDQAVAAIQNLTGNAEALRLLHSGLNGGTVRYLEAGKELNDVAGIAGLSARILGPPRDQKFLARMDPPSDERFLRLGIGGKLEAANDIQPFESVWFGSRKSSPYFAALDQHDKSILATMASDPEALAFALDQALNNTSVVALLTYRGKHLLLPGDAQYGNWENWIKGEEADSLLAEVDFYKVAHHGSYNATPKSALQRMPAKAFAGMVSTQSIPWASIPFPKLMEALAERASGVLRSDSIPIAGAPKGPAPKKLPKGFDQGDFWFDYSIPA